METVKDGMGAVNDMILSRTGSDVDLIPELANHLIDSGGKRLRPMLTLATAQAYGNRSDARILLAASVEFMHTATLLHDDVVDESDLRRGKPAARMVWGNQASVLVGDFLLGQAFKMMVEAGSMDSLDVLSTASAVIAEGEVMQLVTAQNLATTEEDYLKVIDAKTAALFAAAAEVGPILGKAGDDARKAMRDFGRALGVAFQLVDDALDYSGSQAALGKNVGDDLREGKITLPVIVSYQRGNDEDRAFWTRCLRDRDVADADLAHAISLMERHGAIAETLSRARHYAQEAKTALAAAPDCAEREAMMEAVDFAVARAT
ncbi:polyprenyl synthetase family protein [Tepidamorphus sp. 3E244]|uniref:polyprenyl synthetase family protein n=1 Tax=Tepidamorphus sp. 3E244 TaxID=3385498 RepID=UPI0038FC87FA